MNFPLKFIQVLRGFASMAVLLYHIDILSQPYFSRRLVNFRYGELGVDLFFALSGFIITWVHFKDIALRRNVKNFLLKRFIRIFPFYWLAVAAAIIVSPDRFRGVPNLIKNLFLFRLPIPGMVLGVAWSLTFEIIFYAVFALAIVAGWKIARILLAAWVLLILVNVNDVFAWSAIMQLIANNMIVEFLAGCAAGYIFLNISFRLTGLKFFVSLAALACILFILYHFGANRFSLPAVTALGCTSALVILYCATLDRKNRFRPLVPPVLVLTGDASYAIYLTHTIYLPFIFRSANGMFSFQQMGDVTNYILLLGIFIASVAIGIAIHLLIEKPLLIYLRKQFIPLHPASR